MALEPYAVAVCGHPVSLYGISPSERTATRREIGTQLCRQCQIARRRCEMRAALPCVYISREQVIQSLMDDPTT